MVSIFRGDRKNRGSSYLIQVTDRQGRSRTETGFTDRALTERLAATLELEGDLRTRGLVDTTREDLTKCRLTPIDEHLTAFVKSIARRENLPLIPVLIILLREWRANMEPSEPLSPRLHRRWIWLMARKDLERVGIPYEAEEDIAGFYAAGRHKRFVRLRRDGRTVTRPLSACGCKYRDESKKWYIKYKVRDGMWQRVPGYSDKGATAQLAAKLRRKREQVQSGLADPHETGTLRLLRDHLDDFQQFLADKSNSSKHVKQTCHRIGRLLDGCEFKSWKDISPSSFVNWLALERESGRIGVKTSNYYQAASKKFCIWLVKDGRVPSNPVAHLQSLSSYPDVRWRRRPLSGEQFAALVESATSGPPIQCVAGPDRAMLYILAAWTGYRRNELTSLTLRSFDLESTPPTVACQAGYSKRRRNDVILPHDVVVERLGSWLEVRGGLDLDEPLFALRTEGGGLRRTSKMMRFDLERAGILCCDEDGLYADFHANRHTFISNLAKAGVTPKLAQSVARHSDVNLTMGVYSNVQVHEQAAAINTLPAPPIVSTPPVRSSLVNGLVNTTRQGASEESVDHIVDQISDSECLKMASHVVGDAGAQLSRKESLNRFGGNTRRRHSDVSDWFDQVCQRRSDGNN